MAITVENQATPTLSRPRNQTPTAYLKANYEAKKVGEFFSVPLGSLKVLPDFNKRVDYDLDTFVEFVKENGAEFPPLCLMYVDSELYIEQGHRRYSACVEAGLPPETPITVYIGESSKPEERLVRQITTNSGKGYSFIEKVEVVKELIQKYRMDQKTVAKLIGTQQPIVSQMTKFFKYSNLIFTAINQGDIKYTRVLELNKQGLSESDILAIIARENHPEVADTEVDNTEVTNTEVTNTEVDNTEATNTEVDNTEATNTEVTNTEVTNTEVTNTEVTNTEVDDIEVDDIEVDDTEGLSKAKAAPLDKLHEDVRARKGKGKTVKSVGQKIQPKLEDYSGKKANPKTLIGEFLNGAEIVDNEDGSFSYTVSKEAHLKFQKGCVNL